MTQLKNRNMRLAQIIKEMSRLKYGKDVKLITNHKTLEVNDSGHGISREDLPHIFERFYRGDKAREKGGYGLGLSIAKQIADLHGAKIKVKSELGVGTTFKVIFS